MGIRLIVFLFLHKNICCGYSLEVPQGGASNEYPQHMFSWRNKKISNTFGLKKKSALTRAMVKGKLDVHLQSDKGLCCPLIGSTETTECISVY